MPPNRPPYRPTALLLLALVWPGAPGHAQSALPLALSESCAETGGMVSLDCLRAATEFAYQDGRQAAHAEICTSLGATPGFVGPRPTCRAPHLPMAGSVTASHGLQVVPQWGIVPGTTQAGTDGDLRLLVPMNPEALQDALQGRMPRVAEQGDGSLIILPTLP